MSIYWLIFIFPALLSLSSIRLDHRLNAALFLLFGIALILVIGLRYEVGGDWFRYFDTAYGVAIGSDFPGYLSVLKGDYGYRVLHWLSVNYSYGIYSTNLISAAIFTTGLIRFSRTMPMPWLAIAISVPYVIVVVSMGYTRQSVALGLLMWGLVDLLNNKRIFFYLAVFIASFFHMTVLMLIPIAAIYTRNKLAFFLSIVLVVIFLYLFSSQIGHMLYYYITIKYHHSGGALIRVFMTFVAAIVFLICRKEYKIIFNDERMWLLFSIIAIILFPLTFFYSTFTDRFAVYLIPLQLVVFSKIPLLVQSTKNRTIVVVSILVVYMWSLFVWLSYGTHAKYWLPYKNILFMS